MAILKIKEFPRSCVFEPILTGRDGSNSFAGWRKNLPGMAVLLSKWSTNRKVLDGPRTWPIAQSVDLCFCNWVDFSLPEHCRVVRWNRKPTRSGRQLQRCKLCEYDLDQSAGRADESRQPCLATDMEFLARCSRPVISAIDLRERRRIWHPPFGHPGSNQVETNML